MSARQSVPRLTGSARPLKPRWSHARSHPARITPLMAVAGGVAVVTSALFAWALYPLLARLAGGYHAVVIAIAFLGVTTG